MEILTPAPQKHKDVVHMKARVCWRNMCICVCVCVSVYAHTIPSREFKFGNDSNLVKSMHSCNIKAESNWICWEKVVAVIKKHVKK